MYPAKFDYKRAASVAEALTLLAQHEDSKLIAGGHSLIPMMKLRLAQPATVIDIGRIEELRGVEVNGDTLTIGALTPHVTLANSPEIQRACPLLAQAAAEIGDPQVRNRGTIGGNLAHADPASDLPAVVRVLGGRINLRSKNGTRSVAAADFFLDLLTTDLQDGEILISVELPIAKPGQRFKYLKFEHPASGYAVVGAAAWSEVGGDGKVKAAGLAFNGVTATPLVADVSGLVGKELTEENVRAVCDAIVAEDPLGDVFASGEYRLHLAKVYGRRALLG